MNRPEREITDPNGVSDVLRRCDTVSIGLHGGEYPYVVPVSFGFAEENGAVVLYFHGAARGLKLDLIAQDPAVCVEGHIFHRIEPTEGGITTRYESVIGFGRAERVTGGEAVRGLSLILEHYGRGGSDLAQCPSLARTAVYKITLDSITGKRSLPE